MVAKTKIVAGSGKVAEAIGAYTEADGRRTENWQRPCTGDHVGCFGYSDRGRAPFASMSILSAISMASSTSMQGYACLSIADSGSRTRLP